MAGGEGLTWQVTSRSKTEGGVHDLGAGAGLAGVRDSRERGGGGRAAGACRPLFQLWHPQRMKGLQVAEQASELALGGRGRKHFVKYISGAEQGSYQYDLIETITPA